MSRLKVAEKFIEQAQGLQTQPELFRLLQDVVDEIGFRYFALIHHVDLRRVSPYLIRLENYPESWTRYFVENGLYAEDPVHQACLTTNVGFSWAEVPRRIPITSRQRAILENAAKHGLAEGYTVPANIPGESSGSCSFAAWRGLSVPEEGFLVAELIGSFAFQAARSLSGADSHLPRTALRLTPRQLDCLLLAIQGKTDWEIGRILGLSQETVSQHLEMARERYGVTKRLPLAVRAIFDGQISFIEALSWQFPKKRE